MRDAATEVVRRAKSGQKITNLPWLGFAQSPTASSSKPGRTSKQRRRRRGPSSSRPRTQRYGGTTQRGLPRSSAPGGLRPNTLVPKIDSKTYRATVYAMLDAAEHGHQLQPRELAEQMGCSPNTASKWIEQAPQRLLPVMKDAGFNSFEDLLNMPALPDADNETDDEEELDDDERPRRSMT